MGSEIKGIKDLIYEGLKTETGMLAPEGTGIENDSIYSSLFGVSLSPDRSGSLMPDRILFRSRMLATKLILAVSVIFYIALIVGGYTALNRTEGELRELSSSVSARKISSPDAAVPIDVYSKGMDTFSSILSSDPSLYPVFRDISNMIPDGITVNKMSFSKNGGRSTLDIDGTVRYSDMTMENSLMAKYLTALENSASLKRISPPEISSSTDLKNDDLIHVKTRHEVTK